MKKKATMLIVMMLRPTNSQFVNNAVEKNKMAQLRRRMMRGVKEGKSVPLILIEKISIF